MTDASKWIKKLIQYFIGLFLLSLGVGISVASGLGVSPVSALPYVISQISGFELGACTTGIFIIYLILQIIILRKDFKPYSFIQIAISFLFGWFVDISKMLMSFLAFSDNYAYRLFLCGLAIVVVGIGVFLYVGAELIPMPTEGVMLAMVKKTGMQFSTAKIIFDVSSVGVAVALSLIFMHRLEGVREGTILAAIFVGFVVKLLHKIFKNKKTN